MVIIKLLNPYFDEIIKVKETKEQINNMLLEYESEAIRCLILTDKFGNCLSITPENFAGVLIVEDEK